MSIAIRRLAAAAALAATVTLPSLAQADWRYGHRYSGGDVALGVLGGVAAGALIGGALAAPPHPPPPVYYAPPPPRAYAPRPAYVYEEGPVMCRWARQKVWLDSWTYEVRRVRVCD